MISDRRAAAAEVKMVPFNWKEQLFDNDNNNNNDNIITTNNGNTIKVNNTKDNINKSNVGVTGNRNSLAGAIPYFQAPNGHIFLNNNSNFRSGKSPSDNKLALCGQSSKFIGNFFERQRKEAAQLVYVGRSDRGVEYFAYLIDFRIFLFFYFYMPLLMSY